MTQEPLIASVRNFLKRTDMPPSTFGRRAAGDPRFYSDMKSGRVPRPQTAARIRQFMADYEQEHGQ